MTSSQTNAPSDSITVANSDTELQKRISLGELTWTGPLVVVIGRTVFVVVGQALFASVYLMRGQPDPWRSAAHWWTVFGTVADLGCLLLIRRFTAAEHIRIFDLIGPIRLRRGGDLLRGAAYFFLIFPFFLVMGPLSSLLVYGTAQTQVSAGDLYARTLPLWGVVYSLTVWWMIWSPTEETTYQGYVLPRLKALSGNSWVAVLIVGFWWALQHSFVPLILDWKYVLWRFLAFLPGVLVMITLYLWTRRLAPLIFAHWLMDIVGALMTLKF